MAIHIGIDAGGTYTDAVLYDSKISKILASAKALTTRGDLSVGVGEALDKLDPVLRAQADRVFLSTTLATNACVEGKGGCARLIFLNVDKKAAAWAGKDIGLPPFEEIAFLQAQEGECAAAFDAFLQAHPGWLEAADSLAVVQFDARRNGAALEKELAETLAARYSLPVVCGHELFADLNCLRRGVSTLLNGRLIPVIHEFLISVRAAMKARGIDALVSIVRSDGSLMSESFTGIRPVETLLSGPAAGVIGGAYLTGRSNCLLVDMGGTTTDITLIRGGAPVKASDGICIGSWHTFVKGVFVDTFGLGGDSAVRLDAEGAPILETRRSIPLCMAASRWPSILQELEDLLEAEPYGHARPLQEFFILAKAPRDPARFSQPEQALLRALKEGPVSYRQAAGILGTDLYSLRLEPLEEAGIVLRCGLTPTDMMHIRGDFTAFDAKASRLGAAFVARGANMAVEELAGAVYDAVQKKMYANIVRVLLTAQYPAFQKNGIPEELASVIQADWSRRREGGTAYLRPLFHTDFTLVGMGAPIHFFLPAVAEALGAACVIPEAAPVANALGAAVARVEAAVAIEIRPDEDGGGPYTVFAPCGESAAEELEEAVAIAEQEARRAAEEEARRRGAAGTLDFCVQVVHDTPETRMRSTVYLGSRVTVTATGMAYLG